MQQQSQSHIPAALLAVADAEGVHLYTVKGELAYSHEISGVELMRAHRKADEHFLMIVHHDGTERMVTKLQVRARPYKLTAEQRQSRRTNTTKVSPYLIPEVNVSCRAVWSVDVDFEVTDLLQMVKGGVKQVAESGRRPSGAAS